MVHIFESCSNIPSTHSSLFSNVFHVSFFYSFSSLLGSCFFTFFFVSTLCSACSSSFLLLFYFFLFFMLLCPHNSPQPSHKKLARRTTVKFHRKLHIAEFISAYRRHYDTFYSTVSNITSGRAAIFRGGRGFRD